MLTQNNLHKKATFKYFLSILLKNKITWITASLNFAFILSIPFIFLLGSSNPDLNFAENSIFFISVPFILMIISNGLLVSILFLKTKINNVDLFIFLKPIEDKKILFIKQKIIFIFSLHIIIFQIISSIVVVSIGVSFLKTILFLIVMSTSLILMNFVWIFIFTYISMISKYIFGIMIIVLTNIIFIFLPIIIIFTNNSSEVNMDFNAQKYDKNIVKIFSIDKNGSKTKESQVIYENPSALQKRKISIPEPNGFTKYSPFSIMYGLSSNLSSWFIMNDIRDNKKIQMNSNYSVNYNHISKIPFKDSNAYKNVIISGINEKTIFDYSDKGSLFKEISSKIISNEIIKSKLSNAKYWNILKNDLIKKNIWASNLTKDQINLISHIIGIDKTTSLLYNVFNNYHILSKKYLTGLKDYLIKEHNKTFAEFVIYLLSDEKVKLNVFSYNGLGTLKDIYKYHPTASTYDPLKDANKYDVRFIKDTLYRWVKTNSGLDKLEVLDKDGNYIDIAKSSYQNIFKNPIKNKQEFDNYINSHATINNLNNIKHLTELEVNKKLLPYAFKNNVNNDLIFQNQVSVKTKDKFPINYIYLISFVALALLAQRFSIRKISKKDGK